MNISILIMIIGVIGSIGWWFVVCLPWQPWSTREKFDQVNNDLHTDLSDITVLIPARDEEAVIQQTLQGLSQQGLHLKVVLIDDQSSDNTVAIVKQSQLPLLEIIQGQPMPPGWTGKLWALEQGFAKVTTKFTLLLDADIKLNPGTISSLYEKLRNENLDLISLMASLSVRYFWEKLLIPAFIYFFKFLYPFKLANNPRSHVAAAAGGCILVRTDVLRNVGAFSILKEALIDDCSLAKIIKQHGFRTWMGITKQAVSQHSYRKLSKIWQMVTRTAFTQLHYSYCLLFICTIFMLSLFCVPIISLIIASSLITQLISMSGVALMILLYMPILNYYNINIMWSMAMPIIGVLFLLMTWTSAIRYWRGVRSVWKRRIYT